MCARWGEPTTRKAVPVETAWARQKCNVSLPVCVKAEEKVQKKV